MCRWTRKKTRELICLCGVHMPREGKGVESCENTCGDMFSCTREGDMCEDERVNSSVDGNQSELE